MDIVMKSYNPFFFFQIRIFYFSVGQNEQSLNGTSNLTGLYERKDKSLTKTTKRDSYSLGQS